MLLGEGNTTESHMNFRVGWEIFRKNCFECYFTKKEIELTGFCSGMRKFLLLEPSVFV